MFSKFFSQLFVCLFVLTAFSYSSHAQDVQEIDVQTEDSSGTILLPDETVLISSDSDQEDAEESAEDSTSQSDVVFSEVIQSVSGPSLGNDDDEKFFDAEDLVPQGEMRNQSPIKVDPVLQPAQKKVVVQKSYSVDTGAARLVSAERAMALGRYDSSLQIYDELYANSQKDARILMGRAAVLQKVGRFDDAMKMYEVLSEVEPDNIDARVNMLGLLSTKYPAVALRRLLQLYDGHKNHTGLVAQIAVAYAKAGDASSSLRYLGIASAMDPNNAKHVLNMAIIADRSGQTDKAMTYYEQALEIDTIYGGGRSIPRDTVYQRLAQIR